jgi:hypothetical protein
VPETTAPLLQASAMVMVYYLQNVTSEFHIILTNVNTADEVELFWNIKLTFIVISTSQTDTT